MTQLIYQEITDNRRLALFGYVVRFDARIPAHQALKLSDPWDLVTDPTPAGLELQDFHATDGLNKLVMEHH